MTADIYRQHDAAFANVSAYVILTKDGNLVGRIAFKFPRDGAGRLYCYLHILGTRMTRGFASGGGYDKKTAAATAAAEKLSTKETLSPTPEFIDRVNLIRSALRLAGGFDWSRELENKGFVVCQAV